MSLLTSAFRSSIATIPLVSVFSSAEVINFIGLELGLTIGSASPNGSALSFTTPQTAQPYTFAADLKGLDGTTGGLLAEFGDKTSGVYVGFGLDGRFYARCGNGATRWSKSTAFITLPKGTIHGDGNLVFEVRTNPNRIRLWWNGALMGDMTASALLGTGWSSTTAGVWFGAAQGEVVGNQVSAQTATVQSASALRVYPNQVVLDAPEPIWKVTADDWNGTELVGKNITFTQADPAKRPTQVTVNGDTGLSFNSASQQSLSSVSTFDLEGKMVVIQYTATDNPSTAGSYFSANTGTSYIEFQGKNTSANWNRLKAVGIGNQGGFTSYDPIGPANEQYSTLGTKQVAAYIFTTTHITVLINNIFVGKWPRTSGPISFANWFIGCSRFGVCAGMVMYDIAVYPAVDLFTMQTNISNMANGTLPPMLSPYTGDGVLILGDSKANGSAATNEGRDGYGLLGTRTVLAKGRRYARAGALMCSAGEADVNKVAFSFVPATNGGTNFAGEPAILIEYSNNDFDRGYSPLGTPSDMTDTTFWGGMNLGLINVKTYAPNAGVAMIIPFYISWSDTPNAQGLKFWDYLDAIRLFCSMHNITVIDLNDLIDAGNASLYMNDGSHPNGDGHALGGPLIAWHLSRGLKVPTL